MYIVQTIRFESVDQLEATEYRFVLLDKGVFFDGYKKMRRQSKRHKYRTIDDECWERLCSKNRQQKPEVPPDIWHDALSKIREKINEAPGERC